MSYNSTSYFTNTDGDRMIHDYKYGTGSYDSMRESQYSFFVNATRAPPAQTQSMWRNNYNTGSSDFFAQNCNSSGYFYASRIFI